MRLVRAANDQAPVASPDVPPNSRGTGEAYLDNMGTCHNPKEALTDQRRPRWVSWLYLVSGDLLIYPNHWDLPRASNRH